MAFVAVQTAFDGFWINTAENAQKMLEKFGLKIPVAHDSAEGKPRHPYPLPLLMERYRIAGTPWFILIDGQGTVRYNGARSDPEELSRLIAELQAELEKEEK